MLENREANPALIARLRSAFNDSIQTCTELWGDLKFQRWDGDRWRKQALAGLYDAQMLAVNSFDDAQRAKLKNYPNKIKNQTKVLFDDATFAEAVRIGTNTPSRLIYRVKAVRSMLEALL